jgi:isoleucyl-tRNA synthetase
MQHGCAPYKALLTHGFVVDGEGKKMSKSKGNVIAPQKVVDTLGADILRLWVASTDYSGELNISDEILKRVTEAYRRIRNTLRFLLANTTDFDANKDRVAIQDLVEIDQYAIALTQQLQNEITTCYANYEFHPIVARLQSFCSEDLGSFYLDILKDRLYTSGVNSKARRSAQTALWYITQSLLRLIAPILSFTAEEAWSMFASKEEFLQSDETLFTQTYYPLPTPHNVDELILKYHQLREIRADVTKEIENLRITGEVGSSLQAQITLFVTQDKFSLLKTMEEDLKFIFITSTASLQQVASPDEERIMVSASLAQKCERCWHYVDDVGQHPEHPALCGRCIDNLFGDGQTRKFA